MTPQPRESTKMCFSALVLFVYVKKIIFNNRRRAARSVPQSKSKTATICDLQSQKVKKKCGQSWKVGPNRLAVPLRPPSNRSDWFRLKLIAIDRSRKKRSERRRPWVCASKQQTFKNNYKLRLEFHVSYFWYSFGFVRTFALL